MERDANNFRAVYRAIEERKPFKTHMRTLNLLNLSSADYDYGFYFESLKKNRSLTDLSLQVRQTWRKLGEILDVHPSLKILDCHSYATGSKEDFEEFCAGLKKNSKITKLKLICSMDADMIQMLFDALDNHKSISSLDLLGSTKTELIAKRVIQNTSTKNLKIRIDGSPTCFMNIATIIQQDKSLKKISIHAQVFSADSDLLGIALGENNTLTNIAVRGNSSMSIIIRGLKTNTSLKVMKISDFQYPQEAIRIQEFTEALKYNNRIECLYMKHIQIGEYSDTLREFFQIESITDLKLAYCRVLKKDSIELTIYYLQNNKRLKKLGISFDAICTDKISEFMKALKFNSSLTECNLDKIGCIPGALIADLITNNTTLRTLIIKNCQLSDLKIICDALIMNNTLTNIDVSGSSYHNGCHFMASVVKRNRSLIALEFDFDAVADSFGSIDKFCDEMKYNTTINSIRLHVQSRDARGSHTLTKCIEKFNEIFKINRALICFEVWKEKSLEYSFDRQVEKNKKLQSDIKYNTVILMKNILRNSSKCLDLLPAEIWKAILSYISYPGIRAEQFKSIADTVFQHTKEKIEKKCSQENK